MTSVHPSEPPTASAATRLAIDPARLERRLQELGRIGRQENGAIRRLAFTPEDIEARALVRGWMEEAGLEVRIDPAGNIIGRLEGQRPECGALATGSHIDTVPSGGLYDGALGVVGGLEVAATLCDAGLRLDHPLEVIVFADEENTMVGCKSMVGSAPEDADDYRTTIREPIQACLDRIGGCWERRGGARRSAEEMACFLELHVEQGGVLEAVDRQIGVVEGIVGQQRYSLTVEGVANHAGTTPMGMRRDALVTAAQLILAVEDMARHFPGDPVATVGRLQVEPNAANIVPGRVEMTLDMRDLSHDVIDHMRAHLQRKIENIGVTTRTRIALDPLFVVDPTPASGEIQEVIVESCRSLGLSFTHLPSRASHDAQEIGRLAPMGMIFVPSQRGVSHSAEEYTSPQQCAEGVQVLLESLVRLDRQLR